MVHATSGAIARLEESDRRRGGTPTTRKPTSTAKSSQDLLLKPLLSVKEAALLLGLSRSSVYRSIQRGDFPIPVHRINGRIHIPHHALELLVRGLTSTAELA